MFKGRTDLQVEEVNLGFKYEIDKIFDGMNIKKCNLDEKSAKIIGKNIGIYYTIDNIDYYKKSRKIINEIANILNELFDEMKEIHNILIVGLGNKDITPDSLGPLVIHNIEVNRHLEKEKKYSVSALEPGVMGKTGMESSEIIKAIVSKFKPDLVLVIDALACNNPNRMCNSIQISTAGINPGAGVGNFRKEISKKVIGCEVIAIGVPTVCDIEVFSREIDNSYYVTPNNIDQSMEILSNIIYKAINTVLL